MDQPQQDLRLTAAKAFKESLEQLQQTLQAAEEPSVPSAPQPSTTPRRSTPLRFDLHSFEQAAADIEQFMQARQAGHS